MADSTGKKLLQTSESLYRFLLSTYPEAHRREYGALMAQLFRDLCRDVYNAKGFRGLLGLWGHVLIETVSTAADEHLQVWQEGVQIMTTKQHVKILISAGLPLFLGLVLSFINPRFMGHMLTPNDAQPLGWLMTAGVLVLAILAYIFQRKIILVDDPPKRVILFVCNSLFLVLPATLLVLLGPAIITLIQAGLNP